MSLPKYDCAAHPSILLDPAQASPLNSNQLYILSVYDQERVPTDDFSFDLYDPAGWATVGLARFSADDRSFHIADHKITTANWNEALHSLSWSDAREGTARVPMGSLHFSDDLQTFLGIVMTSEGQKRTISGLVITGYHTRRSRKDSDNAFNSYDLFYGAVRYSGEGPQMLPFCQLWDPENYDDDDDDEHGFKYDVSNDAYFTGGVGSNFVKPRGTGDYAYVSFNIKFKADLKSFEGTFSENNEERVDKWTGTSFDIPADVRKLIEDRLKNGSDSAIPDAKKTLVFESSEENGHVPPSYTIDTYLPGARIRDDPPPYALMMMVTDPEQGMNELKLWQISSIQRVKDETSKEDQWIVADIVQAYVGKASHNIFMASLPQSVKKKFKFTDPFLEDEEKAIMEKYAKFNNAASIAYFAQALEQSAAATQSQKEQINKEKTNAWFKAMSSLEPPTDGTSDPVTEAGLKRDDNLKELQKAYSAQMDDLYKFYYKRKVADFLQYCRNQSTAQKWFEKLKAYVQSGPFVAQWASSNANINYKDSSRTLMEASVKLNILEDIGYPKREEKKREGPEIIKTLAALAAWAQASSSVGYDPTLVKQIETMIQEVGSLTEEEIRKKYGDLIEEYKQLQTLITAYGGTRAFSDWFLKIARYHKDGKGSFNSLLQMAGDQIKSIWNKLTKGKSRGEVIAEFGKEIVELAEEPMKSPENWKKVRAAWGKFKGGVKTVFAHLAVVGTAAGLIAVAAGQWGAVDTGVRVFLGLEAFAYALRGAKLFASTALGKFLKAKVLDNKAFLQRVGEWFTKEGIPKDIPGSSIIGKLLGRNVKTFLRRLGAVLAVAMLVVCAFDFKNALASGKPMEIAESAIFLVLAIIDVAVVATGIIAKIAGATSVAACAGPIGLAFAAIGLVVAIVFFILKLTNPEPPPDPVQDFIDDELDKAGFKKKK